MSRGASMTSRGYLVWGRPSANSAKHPAIYSKHEDLLLYEDQRRLLPTDCNLEGSEDRIQPHDPIFPHLDQIHGDVTLSLPHRPNPL